SHPCVRGRAHPCRRYHRSGAGQGQDADGSAVELCTGSDTARRHVDFAWVGLGIGDKLGNGVGWNRWVEHHDERHADDARHRRDVAYEIEVEVVIERHIDRVGRSNLQKRIAVRRRLQGCLSADIAGSARSVFYYELLAETL